jgi:hypothetical protein
MFSKDFVKKLGKECLVAFITTFGVVALADPTLGAAAITAGAVAGFRAVLGVVVKNVGSEKDSPHL